MSGSLRITHRPCPNIPREQARDLRAQAWAYIFNCWRNKEDRPAEAPDNKAETKEGSNDEQILPN